MSFWDLSDGGNAADTGSEYEIPGGGNFDPIPDGSNVLAMIDEIGWANDNDGNEYINARWTVLDPEEYKNRKIFQKLWVTDFDPRAKDDKKAATKRDKARRMLAAIDANASGALSKNPGVPNDDQLAAALMNKPMVIKCMVWSMPDREKPGENIEGNWIAAVAPANKGVEVKEAKPRPASKPASGGASALELDDEIPF